MASQEDDVDAGSPGVGEDLLQGPAGVLGVAGVGVEDRPVVPEVGERCQLPAL